MVLTSHGDVSRLDWQVMTLISALVTTAAAMAPDFSPEDRALAEWPD